MKERTLPRKPIALSESIQRWLGMYALSATAAGVGMLALAHPAEAKIIYTPAHRAIEPNSTYNLDLNHDGTADFEFSNVYGRSTGSHPYGALTFHPAQMGNGVRGYGTNYVHNDSALRAGAQIGPRGHFFYTSVNLGMVMGPGDNGGCQGEWKDVKHRYLGLKFMLKGKTHFGWARASVSCNPQDFKITVLLTGYAYETVPNKPIVAGKTKGPDVIALPMETKAGTLGHLALGRR